MDDSDDTLKLHRDLIIACGWGKEVDVILLLQQGASVRVQDQDGKNCLHYAACKGHIQVTNLLIENGCNINARDKSDRTPLHLAAEEGHHDILSILLDKNAEFDVQDEDGNTPCHVACLNDYFEVVELLIHVKADLNIKNKDGFTPLHIATLNHHVKSMNLLIKAGVSKSAQDANGNTALHIAVQTKSMKAFKTLVKHGADVNVKNHDGNTPLHLCAENGNTQFVDYLFNVDQPVQLGVNNVGDTAKDIAIRHGYKELAQMIPDPSSKKKKSTKERHTNKCCTSESRSNSPATSLANPSPTHSRHSDDIGTSPKRQTAPPHLTANTFSPPTNHHPTAYVDPSEEPTSSSLLSLFVPTTDSGISLPMDVRGDQTPVTSLQRRKTHTKQKEKEKPMLFDELQQYDSHRINKDRSRPRTSSKKEEVYTHEYKELRYDPRFMSPQINPKNRGTGKSSHKFHNDSDRRYSDQFIDSGALSDESIQAKGCFFKTKSKKTSRSSMRTPKQLSAEAEKEIMMVRQAELQYQLNVSKLSLEKQMRKMRKKFERALQATDERFIEQKKREESFHYQLRNELEIIEKSLERGSKKNVEEFTHHIKAELNNLADRLMRGADINASDTPSDETPARRLNKRESAVDLDKDISVSLQRNVNSPTKSSKKKRHTNSSSTTSSKTEEDKSLIKVYEERVKELEREAKIKETKERENKELRARILELERIVMANNSKTAVT